MLRFPIVVTYFAQPVQRLSLVQHLVLIEEIRDRIYKSMGQTESKVIARPLKSIMQKTTKFYKCPGF